MKFFYGEEPKRRKIEKSGLKETTFLWKLTRGKNTIFLQWPLNDNLDLKN